MARLPPSSPHRDVGSTDCPGNAAYAVMDEIQDIAAHFNDPRRKLIKALEGGVYQRWQALGGMNSAGCTDLAGGRRARMGRGMQPSSGRHVLVAGDRQLSRSRGNL